MSNTAPASTLGRVINILDSMAGIPTTPTTPETRLDDALADSLERIELGMYLEDDFALEIPDEHTVAWRTVGDVVAYLERRIGGQS